jgi:hypothetical protein
MFVKGLRVLFAHGLQPAAVKDLRRDRRRARRIGRPVRRHASGAYKRPRKGHAVWRIAANSWPRWNPALKLAAKLKEAKEKRGREEKAK